MMEDQDQNHEAAIRRREIKAQIESNNLERAAKRLIDYAREFGPNSSNGAVLISQQLHSVLEGQRTGSRTVEYIDIERTKIAQRILELSDHIYMASSMASGSEPARLKPEPAQRSSLLDE